jgi:murein DD-endopeptidase MepM/ murein hydrolase activator NlpD
VNNQETRADKPRRALPTQSRRFSGDVLRSLLRRGAAVVVVSGIGLAGLATFTASASPANAAALPSPLGLSSIGTDFGAEKSPNAAALAEQRKQSINADASAISSSSADAATTERFQAMGANANVLDDENQRLKTLSKFMWPTKGEVGSVYGPRLHPILHYWRMHDGDDIGGACGQPIWAAQSGTVVKAEMGYNGGSGNNVRIDHGDINGVDIQTGYLHMSKYIVSVGDKVDKGDVIGYVGSTGLSTACHLHFSAYKNGSGTDPMEFIGWNPEGQRAPKHN